MKINAATIDWLVLIKLSFIVTWMFFALFISTQTAFAQNSSPSPSPSSKTEVSFPITDLDGCENLGECIKYCDDPVNYNVCVEYAKKKGFYEQDKVQTQVDQIIEQAKDDLGCNSKEACLDFCSKVENRDLCDAFAKSQNITGGYVQQPDKPEFLEQAKKVLGCDSAESCSSFCDNPANADKCDEFADTVGLLGGNVTEGPGGCISGETCTNFCKDPNNFSSCQPYAPPNSNFQGPGGCNDSASCRTFCEENPDQCRSYAPGSSGVYVPITCPAGQYFGPGGACTPNEKTEEAAECSQGGKYWSGDSCADTPPPGINPTVGGGYFQPRREMGNCQTPGDCYDYCKENPGKCGGFNAESPRPPDTYVPNLYYTPGSPVKHSPVAEMGGCTTPGGCYDYCKENPGKCQGFNSNAPRPADTFMPGTYYTPPRDFVYTTPPATSFYVTPVYYTPPQGSNYSTPSYYTPGMYSTPNYYTPPQGSNYSTPTYYTPGTYYATPQGSYPTPSYNTPVYYSPPINYSTPSYYTPSTYVTPNYYTPPPGSNYTTPNYTTPPPYNTPSYYTPYTGGNYTTPIYYTPPPGSNYTPPSYPTPVSYNTPNYYTPPPGSSYSSPTYYSPAYSTPSYYTPPPGSTYTTPSYNSPSYYTPSSYNYPTPSTGYSYPTPSSGGGYSYPSPSYYTPSTSYSYPTPSSYSYPSPSYNTPPPPPPDSYSTPSYNTPPPPPPPSEPPPPPPPSGNAGQVAGVSFEPGLLQALWSMLFED